MGGKSITKVRAEKGGVSMLMELTVQKRNDMNAAVSQT